MEVIEAAHAFQWLEPLKLPMRKKVRPALTPEIRNTLRRQVGRRGYASLLVTEYMGSKLGRPPFGAFGLPHFPWAVGAYVTAHVLSVMKDHLQTHLIGSAPTSLAIERDEVPEAQSKFALVAFPLVIAAYVVPMVRCATRPTSWAFMRLAHKAYNP